MNDKGELDDEALRDVDVDVVVAWWLNACLLGDRSGQRPAHHHGWDRLRVASS